MEKDGDPGLGNLLGIQAEEGGLRRSSFDLVTGLQDFSNEPGRAGGCL